MAYAFEKIMNAMDDGKVNVFGGGQNTDTQGQQPGGQGEMKTEATGDASGGGSTQGGGRASFTQTPEPSSTVGSQRAIEAAKAQAPANIAQPLGRVSTQLQKANADLQAEANQYKQTQLGKQNYEISTPDIEKGIAGDREIGGRIATTLSKTKADPVERFAPKTDYDIEEIEQFKSAPGLSRYMRSQYGPRYTAGAAALDVGRLQADPQFQASVQNLENQQRLLRESANQYVDPEKGVQREVESEANARFATQKKALQDYLESQGAALDAQNQAEMDAYLAQVEAAKSPEARAQVVGGRQSDIQSRIAEVVRLRPELAKYLTPEYMQGFGINPNDFVNFASTEGLSRDRFYDDKEAARFNAIMGLLGRGGQSRTAAEPLAPVSSFDLERYMGNVAGVAENRNAQADAEARERLRTIMDRAQGRYQSAIDQYGNLDAERNRLAAEARAGLGQPVDENLVDVNQFFRRGEMPTRPEDFLTDRDAYGANEAYEELMDPRRLQGGSMRNYNPYSWDAAGYQKALRDALSSRATPVGPVGEGALDSLFRQYYPALGSK